MISVARFAHRLCIIKRLAKLGNEDPEDPVPGL